MQLKHSDSRFIKKTFPLILICDNIENSSNIGGLLRLADAFGVSEIYFVGEVKSIGHKIRRASRSTENYVDYKFIDDAMELISELKSKKFKITALEITKNSFPINEWTIEPSQKIALIVGNEAEGVQAKYLDFADEVIHIELFGNNTSINVTTATAIALQNISSGLSNRSKF